MMHLYYRPARLVAEDGFVNVVLSYDQAKDIEDALETALAIAPCEGGVRTVAAEATAAQMIAWEAGFHDAVASLKRALAISEAAMAQNRDGDRFTADDAAQLRKHLDEGGA